MDFNNLSKVFKYVNELGQEIIFLPKNGYLINKPTGIDTLAVSISQAKGINQIGVTIQSKNIQPRPINVTGRIFGDSQILKKEKLQYIVRPDLKGRFYADDYYLDVAVTKTPTIEYLKDFAHFDFSLLAPYPYWQKSNNRKEILTGLVYKFKFPCNFSKPYRFAEFVDKKFFNVVNRGQTATPFTLTLIASELCRNPKLVNINTKKFLQINKELKIDERVTIKINHDGIKVMSSIDGDIDGALSIDSNLFQLESGDNVFKPEAEVGLKGLKISIEFNEEKVGIAV